MTTPDPEAAALLQKRRNHRAQQRAAVEPKHPARGPGKLQQR